MRAQKQCRYYLDSQGDFIKPCACTGSIKYIHRDYLKTWIAVREANTTKCEICGFSFIIYSFYESFLTWIMDKENRKQSMLKVILFIIITTVFSSLVALLEGIDDDIEKTVFDRKFYKGLITKYSIIINSIFFGTHGF